MNNKKPNAKIGCKACNNLLGIEIDETKFNFSTPSKVTSIKKKPSKKTSSKIVTII